MVEERRKTDLDGAALICAVILNVNSGKRARTITPMECHPFRESEPNGTRLTRGNIATIARAIVGQ